MKNIKVYDIRNYIESLDLMDGKEIMFDTKMAILVGTPEVIIVNEEGCGEGYENVDENYEVYLSEDCYYKIKIKDIIENIPYKEMLLTEFINRYNIKSRIKDNLIEILGIMNKIGIDAKKYCTKGYINKTCQSQY